MTAAGRAAAWMVLTAASFALGLVAIRALAPRFSPEQILLFRAVFAVVVFAPGHAAAGLAAMRGPAGRHFAGCGLAACIGIGSWNWAVPRMPLADATALNFTLPLFTVVLAAAFLGERMGPRRALALALGFAGVLVILRPGFAEIGVPALVALANPLAFAVAAILIRALARQGRTGPVIFNMHLVMAAAALAASLATGWAWPRAGDLPWVLGVGVFGTLAYVGVVRSLALVEAGVYAAFDFLRLPFATLVAVAWFGEPLDAWTWAGALVIVASSVWNARIADRRAVP